MRYKAIYILLITLFAMTACTDPTKVRGITLLPERLTLGVGEEAQIEMIITPISADIYNPKSWKSSDENVARVNGKGIVTALSAGECVITCQTSNAKAECHITVTPPSYSMIMSSAIASQQRQLDNKNQNITLRLYDQNLSIDPDGNTHGNGYILNLSLILPPETTQPSEGTFEIDSTQLPYTAEVGKIIKEGLNYYATGSYLGYYSDNGLSASFITSGSITIKKEGGNFNIECNLTGENQEKIKIRYNGEIVYEPYIEREEHTLTYTSFSYKSIVVSDESNLNHMEITVMTDKGEASFYLRTPLSATDYIPSGRYSISAQPAPFTMLHPDNALFCHLMENGDTTAIFHSGELRISENETGQTLEAELYDRDKNKYTIMQSDSNQ